MFASVGAQRHAKSKLKIKALEESIPEIVSLYHSESLDFLVPYSELHPAEWTGGGLVAPPV